MAGTSARRSSKREPEHNSDDDKPAKKTKRVESSTGVVTFDNQKSRKSARPSIPPRRFGEPADPDDAEGNEEVVPEPAKKTARSKGGSKTPKSKSRVETEDDEEQEELSSSGRKAGIRILNLCLDRKELHKQQNLHLGLNAMKITVVPERKSQAQSKGKDRTRPIRAEDSENDETVSVDEGMDIDPPGYGDTSVQENKVIVINSNSDDDSEPEVYVSQNTSRVCCGANGILSDAKPKRKATKPKPSPAKTPKLATSASVSKPTTLPKESTSKAKSKSSVSTGSKQTRAKGKTKAEVVDEDQDPFVSPNTSHRYASGVKKLSGPIRYSPIAKRASTSSIPVSPTPKQGGSSSRDPHENDSSENSEKDESGSEDSNNERERDTLNGTGFTGWQGGAHLDVQIPKVSGVHALYSKEPAWKVTRAALNFAGSGNFANPPRADPRNFTWHKVIYGENKDKILYTMHRIVSKERQLSPVLFVSPVLCLAAHLNQPIEASVGMVKKCIEGFLFPHEAERTAAFFCLTREVHALQIQTSREDRTRTPIRFETRQGQMPIYDLRRNFSMEKLSQVSSFPPWKHPEPPRGSVLLMCYTATVYHPKGDTNKEALGFNILWAGVLHGGPQNDNTIYSLNPQEIAGEGKGEPRQILGAGTKRSVLALVDVIGGVEVKAPVLSENGQRVNGIIIAIQCCLLDAAFTAGLNVLHLINEGAAAALGSSNTKSDIPDVSVIDARQARPRHIMFVDVGHSSLRVSSLHLLRDSSRFSPRPMTEIL
ncbi:hypothetical protein C8J56DRAFT_1029236 [Mycena floridula]|nr:hypothetical protein C8J56DRAFT_1029236 [Mycena floridula]